MRKTNKTIEDFENAAKNSYSISGMCRKLGWNPTGSYNVIKKYIEIYNIDTSHFTGIKMKLDKDNSRLSASEYAKQYYCKGSVLLKKLIQEGIKERKCECCNNTEWNGKPIPLELHHIDGNHYNNDIQNLMSICPNCHAQTDTYKNRKDTPVCKNCGDPISKYSRSGLCVKCNHELHQRKVEWPTKQELSELIVNTPNTKIAKIYGVSDKTVAKWLKIYGITKNKKQLICLN